MANPLPAPRARTPLLARWFASSEDDAPWRTVMLFITPALAVYALFTAYPVFRTVWNSLHTIKPGNIETFVGFDNYVALFTGDAVFYQAVGNTLIWAFVAPFLDVLMGFVLAIALYSGVSGARFFRVAWFTPVLISYVVVGIMWMWIYNYDWGAVNEILRAVGLGRFAHAWLGTPDTALAALIVTHAWKWTGFNMVVCLAALHALPKEVLEAADLDNCGWWAKVVHVVVPMIRPTLLNLVILSFIGKMKIFDLVWIMTRGGPLWSTETVSTYVYKRAFEWNTFDLGYPSAVAVVWFVVVIGAVLLLSWVFRQRDRIEY